MLVGKGRRAALPKVVLTAPASKGGRWHTLGHVRESASGSFSLTVRAPRRRARAAVRVMRDARARAAGASPTLARRRGEGGLQREGAPHLRGRRGHAVTVTGGRGTPTARGSVALRRELHGRWVTPVTSGWSLPLLRLPNRPARRTCGVSQSADRVRAEGVRLVFTVVVRTPARHSRSLRRTLLPAAPTQSTVSSHVHRPHRSRTRRCPGRPPSPSRSADDRDGHLDATGGTAARRSRPTGQPRRHRHQRLRGLRPPRRGRTVLSWTFDWSSPASPTPSASSP